MKLSIVECVVGFLAFDRENRVVESVLFPKPAGRAVEALTNVTKGGVPEELTEKTLEALGSKRNRQILIELASHHKKHSASMTVSELFEKMELRKGAKKGLWRNLETLVRCGLVERIPEGRKLHKYSIYGNKTSIRIRFPLDKKRQR